MKPLNEEITYTVKNMDPTYENEGKQKEAQEKVSRQLLNEYLALNRKRQVN